MLQQTNFIHFQKRGVVMFFLVLLPGLYISAMVQIAVANGDVGGLNFRSDSRTSIHEKRFVNDAIIPACNCDNELFITGFTNTTGRRLVSKLPKPSRTCRKASLKIQFLKPFAQFFVCFEMVSLKGGFSVIGGTIFSAAWEWKRFWNHFWTHLFHRKYPMEVWWQWINVFLKIHFSIYFFIHQLPAHRGFQRLNNRSSFSEVCIMSLSRIIKSAVFPFFQTAFSCSSKLALAARWSFPRKVCSL